MDSKVFCHSCGIDIDEDTEAEWCAPGATGVTVGIKSQIQGCEILIGSVLLMAV